MSAIHGVILYLVMYVPLILLVGRLEKKFGRK
jgi:hypothetical protein